MNWNRESWSSERYFENIRKKKHVFSNLTETFTEFPNTGPYGIELKDMADANQATLRLFRTACRKTPSLLNRPIRNFQNDYHMSKRFLAMWFRRGKNMKNTTEIASTLQANADVLFEALYGNGEPGIYCKYFQEYPDSNDGFKSVIKNEGYDIGAFKKFAGKTRFFEKFVKGSRNLMK